MKKKRIEEKKIKKETKKEKTEEKKYFSSFLKAAFIYSTARVHIMQKSYFILLFLLLFQDCIEII